MVMQKKATHILFSKTISVYALFNNQSFNDTLTNDTVSFEQLGPGWSLYTYKAPYLELCICIVEVTWFSKVCRSVFPGVGSNSSLWAFSITSITSCCNTIIQ